MGKKIEHPGSKKPTSSLARRMHDGYDKQIRRKLQEGRSSLSHMTQEDWDAIFVKGEK